jgi:hypothetical protein
MVVRFAQAHQILCDLVPPYGREHISWNHETLFSFDQEAPNVESEARP